MSGRTRERERCERCGREADTVFTVRVGVHPDPDADRVVCAECHEEIRLFLLGLAHGSTPHGEVRPEAGHQAAEDRSSGSRALWFLLRAIVYVGIAVAIFALATWLSSL